MTEVDGVAAKAPTPPGLDSEAVGRLTRQTEAAWLARLAAFPEQNPNLVIEIDGAGQVSYLNPVARERFPELDGLGRAHPLLADLDGVAARLIDDPGGFLAREVDLGDRVFEQKICPIADAHGGGLRVFASEVTDLRRAHEDVRRLARRVVEAQEEERLRISRELHDDAGQALTALRIGLKLVVDDLPEDRSPLRDELGGIVGLIEETHERIRAIARGLRPPLLDTVGLVPALRAECQGFAERTGIAVDCGLAIEAPRLSEAASIAAYRMVQEGLTNVLRHASAGRVDLGLQQEGGRLQIALQDDGCGFDLRSLDHSTGIGLRGLRERFALIGGSFVVESQTDRGTRLVGWLETEGELA
jgi:signal transduction histidine kinase